MRLPSGCIRVHPGGRRLAPTARRGVPLFFSLGVGFAVLDRIGTIPRGLGGVPLLFSLGVGFGIGTIPIYSQRGLNPRPPRN